MVRKSSSFKPDPASPNMKGFSFLKLQMLLNSFNTTGAAAKGVSCISHGQAENKWKIKIIFLCNLDRSEYGTVRKPRRNMLFLWLHAATELL